jgi:hypothetical protein
MLLLLSKPHVTIVRELMQFYKSAGFYKSVQTKDMLLTVQL